jgi:hypothetical protein
MLGCEIRPNQKFALVATSASVDHRVPQNIALGSGTWVTTGLPIGLDSEWKRWIGSIRAETIEEDCNLFLCVAMGSALPGVVDAESPRLAREVSALFEGLLLTGNINITRAPIQIGGARVGDGMSVRQIGDLLVPRMAGGVEHDDITEGMLQEAFRFMSPFLHLYDVRAPDRVRRILGIHSKALREPNTLERLHQFCRCIEGFILPATGKTAKQFVSRTEMFVGPRHHSVMQQLYDMRSKVEHMQDFDLPGHLSERERRLEVLKMVAMAQGLARYCVGQFLGRRALWPHFADNNALAAFWQLDRTDRQAIWGDPLDLKALIRRFNPAEFTNEALGLPP